MAELIAQQYARQPGNYLCFVSSFDYLQQVAATLERLHPQLPLWLQQRGMDEAGRAEFLARFVEGGQGLGLAVLGGAFSEGVDLPGSRLIGAFVATLGLPQLNPVNEAMQRAMDQAMGVGLGYDYTYLYPGLRKVVQAAGRVIRSEHDRGVLVLMDDRFARAEVRALLPAWWQIEGAPRFLNAWLPETLAHISVCNPARTAFACLDTWGKGEKGHEFPRNLRLSNPR
jgi:DNA excision repair protein ERCC-2